VPDGNTQLRGSFHEPLEGRNEGGVAAGFQARRFKVSRRGPVTEQGEIVLEGDHPVLQALLLRRRAGDIGAHLRPTAGRIHAGVSSLMMNKDCG
jgi:hypothetical protein